MSGTAAAPRLPMAVLEALRCPTCGECVSDDGGTVRCARGHDVRWRDGYLDCWVGTEDDDVVRTIESFGYEWTTFDDVREEDERFWQRYVADVPLDALAGTLALDAACGKARYTRHTAAHVGTMVALDGSLAVEAAARNLADVDNAVVVRADLHRVPFDDGAFGFVSCLGVLHHLPEPRVGFDELVRLLAPGGRLLVYVYSRPERPGVRASGLRAADALRRRTVRMEHRRLRALCAPIAGLLYAGVVVPGRIGERIGVRALARLPLQVYRGQPVRSLWLDTFDRLSAPLEVRYVWTDLEPWYRQTGLEVEAVREDAGLYVLARKPG